MMDRQLMFMESPSGYMMPFLFDDDDNGFEVMLGYGDQIHPVSGERFFHQGIDIVCDHQPLLAVASGLVVGVGNDAVLGTFISVRYGKYHVRYGHVSETSSVYGSRVVAGQEIARSGDFLHLDVRYDGEHLDPEMFLKMLFGNVCQLVALDMEHFPEGVAPDLPVVTDYDSDMEEIEALQQKWLPAYFSDILSGKYKPSDHTVGVLGHLMEQAAERGYIYQDIPSLTNPIGLSGDGADVAGRAQTELIEDFLVWLSSRHGIYVSSWDDDKKKRLIRRHGLQG